MSLNLVKHSKIDLKQHPTLNEVWLQNQIQDDPSILGLGKELRLLERERVISSGGKLDFLFADDESDRRYEVEIQLGKTDPSHIIRCIEYWDAERRKYPTYDHIAVLVAENITTRFLNVIGLFSGNIPIIAIQVEALAFENNLLLNFSRILDQTELRSDDEDEASVSQADRSYWDSRAQRSISLCDRVLEIVNEVSPTPYEFNYTKGYISLRSNGLVDGKIRMSPKRGIRRVNLRVRNPNYTSWQPKLEEKEIASRSKRGGFVIELNDDALNSNLDLIKQIVNETLTDGTD